MRLLAIVAIVSMTVVVIGCVEEPERDIAGAWDAAIQDALADADADLSDRDATGDYEAENDVDTVSGDETLVPDEKTDDDFPCMWNSCVVHEDCKRRECVATFCTTELGELVVDNPNVCAVRCDPANNSAECPEEMICNDQVPLAGQLGKDIDGAKGICAPPMRQKIAFSY